MYRWFRHFKNNDFEAEDKECSGRLKKFDDRELEALLHEDSSQMQTEFKESFGVDHTTVLKCMKTRQMIQKQRHWVPCELKPRDVKQRLMCEQQLQRQERFLHCIMTDNEKRIHYNNSKCRRS